MQLFKLLCAVVCAVSMNVARADADADIRAVLTQVASGYEHFDAKKVAAMYTDDAVWRNPFGVVLHGRVQIEQFLVKLFGRSVYRAGVSDNNFVIDEIHYRSPNVAAVWSQESGVSQETDQSNKVIGVRKTHYLDVLVHGPDGWRITDEIIMDES